MCGPGVSRLASASWIDPGFESLLLLYGPVLSARFVATANLPDKSLNEKLCAPCGQRMGRQNSAYSCWEQKEWSVAAWLGELRGINALAEALRVPLQPTIV